MSNQLNRRDTFGSGRDSFGGGSLSRRELLA